MTSTPVNSPIFRPLLLVDVTRLGDRCRSTMKLASSRLSAEIVVTRQFFVEPASTEGHLGATTRSILATGMALRACFPDHLSQARPTEPHRGAAPFENAENQACSYDRRLGSTIISGRPDPHPQLQSRCRAGPVGNIPGE
jgi:hypothetical protein